MLQDTLQKDFITAMKARETLLVETLKMIRSAIKNFQIDVKKDITDEDILAILRSELKKRNEAIELYTKGNRSDLADKESAEAEIIKKYLPQMMSADQVKAEMVKIAQQLGETANFAMIMRTSMAQLKGKADGKLVSEIAKQIAEGK